MEAEQLESEFLAACEVVKTRTGNEILDICSVLNQMPGTSAGASDTAFIDRIDQLLDDLFHRSRLSCPGHKWLSGPVASIRHGLTSLLEQGYLHHDPISGAWVWQSCTFLFVIWGDGEIERVLGRLRGRSGR